MKKINLNFLKEIFLKIKNYHFDSFLILYIILPVLLNFIITCLELKSIFKGVAYLFTSPYIFIANTLIILMTLSITLLVRRRLFFLGVLSFLWLAIGVANFVLLCNRVTPFTACDLYLLDSLFDIMQKYFNWFQIILLCTLVVAIIIGLIVMFFKAPRITRKIHYLRCIICIGIICGLTVGSVKLGVATGIMDGQFAELSAAYRKNGFAYCFTNSLIDTGVNRPKDYSAETIAGIIAEDNSSVDGDTAEETPNIIIIQLESFFDISSLDGIEFSEDFMPNFHKYQDLDGGLFSVPVVGAGTSNVEFEVMTGMNLDHFGAGEYPFKTILLETTCESMAYNLKTYGYHTMVMHNHTGTFYSRNEVYSNLGFDRFQSVEYMQDVERTPMGWAKDMILTDYILRTLNETPNQDLVYTISVQGHGTYAVEDGYEKHITVTNTPENRKDYLTRYEYYVNMLYEMDQFVGDLVSALEDFKEDTILVMYGDHLPSLDIDSGHLNGRDMYQTDYFIWNNMGKTFDFGDISANEISALLMKELGMTNGILNSFRQNHATDEDFDECLAALEYDILYGDQLVYGGSNPYEPTEIQMGMDEVLIHNIVPHPYLENQYLVLGENFTKYSKVYLNDEKQTTKYVDANTLILVPDKDLEVVAGDALCVWQSSLSSTEDYIYNIIPMIKDTPRESDEN